MAGFTSTFPFKPLLSSSTPKPSLLSLSSFDSKLFGLRISNPDFFNSTSHFSALRCSISARYGGGGGGGGSSRSGSGDYRRSKQSNSDDDQALDMSTVRSDIVRLIDAQQNMVGVVSKNEAVQMALDAELDLVILSPDADPPVVRIMDYNKYRYELQKKKREQQKKTNRVDLKELKMGYNIDVRLKAAWKFLNDGDKVKIIVNLKGRENEFRNNAIELIRHFQNDVGESYNRDLFLFLYFLLIIVSAITSFKIHHDKSPISGKSILYLNRHQTEEWKGWMQECQIMQLAWRLQMHQAHLRCMNQIRLLQLLLLICCCCCPCG